MSAPVPAVTRRLLRSLSRFVAPSRADLARGMVAELDAIEDPTEARRFALGALAAIARMSIRRPPQSPAATPARLSALGTAFGSHPGGSPMLPLSTRQLLQRCLIPFVTALVAITGVMLSMFGMRVVKQLGERGESIGTILGTIALGLPFTMAMTVPMAVFVAVIWVFARLGAEGGLSAARHDRNALRALLVPVLIGATTIGALMFVSNTQLLPHANARLGEVLSGGRSYPSDRTMTVGELRAAAIVARAEAGTKGNARAAAFEVEVQKKFAISAACIVLALAGVTIALRFPRGGAWLVTGSSIIVFMGYYGALIAGETLADRMVLSPMVAMWTANALVLGLGALLLRPAIVVPQAVAKSF
ncbi:MAG: LptF/LptG family permease [Gemmatimonadetes bacterium]|nr:LptF/LptG family permease [Gemmatimonadota bacterium]